MRNALLKIVFCLALLPALAEAARCPNILVVFDVSGSMSSNVSGTNPVQNRYEVGRDAVNSLLAGNTVNFRYGLELFGITAGSDSCSVSSCYYTSTNSCQSVLCDYNTGTPIGSVLAVAGPDGSTPTAKAIDNAMQRADMKDTTRSRYIILITDGDPTCPSGNTTSDTTTAVNSITAAKNAGVKTYVLGFTGGVTPSRLNSMAIAGGTQRQASCSDTSLCYYDAASPSQLQSALDTIVAQVGGELGGTACDDTCYSVGGCAANQICKGGTCVADPCATVSCQSGTYCIEGVCKHTCNPACQSGQFCDDGVCKPNAACATACTAKNSTCINGQCVEDYCSGQTYKPTCSGADDLCVDNACQTFAGGAGGGSGGGTGAGGGTGSHADGGTNGSGTTSTSGCCSGAPDAASLFGILVGLSSLGALRRRARK